LLNTRTRYNDLAIPARVLHKASAGPPKPCPAGTTSTSTPAPGIAPPGDRGPDASSCRHQLPGSDAFKPSFDMGGLASNTSADLASYNRDVTQLRLYCKG